MFNGRDKPDIISGWKLYEDGEAYKNRLNLYDTVRVNENFFVGRQWEGVEANGLPTPQIPFLKRTVGFVTATVTTDNIRVTASPLSNTPKTDDLVTPAQVVNDEFEALAEQNKIPALLREFSRNAAVDGDGCTYTYWDETAETGQENVTGAIKTEIVENTRVYFGNVSDRRVQTQPYIIIRTEEITRLVRKKARENGFTDWESIHADEDDKSVDAVKRAGDKTTVLLLLWRSEETGTIWQYEFTRSCGVTKPFDMGIKLYPVTWLNWDYVKDSYHGQAMLTGLIPNQIAINKMAACLTTGVIKMAWPKFVYDKTKIAKLDNRIGAAIGVAGGDLANCIKVIDPPAISPQVGQLIDMMIEKTQESLGATAVALGDTRPDNTSAIIALQRAASTPSEQTKQNLYQSCEDLFRIYLDFMAEYYGTRTIDTEPPEQVRKAYQFAGQEVPQEIQIPFDFGILKNHPMILKLDVGASSYYSEIASMQTLDNLLMNGHITPLQYLERVPDGYIPARRALIAELKEQMQTQQMPPMTAPQSGEVLTDEVLGEKPDIPTGGGFSALQRKVLEQGTTEGLV